MSPALSSRDADAVKVGFVTLGCPKNQVDSEVMQGLVEDAGFSIAPPQDAQLVVVNTCGFIEDAQEESIETILSLAMGEGQKVVAVGCLVERFGRELAREIPEVTTWIGLGAEHRIGEILASGAKGLFLENGPPVALSCWQRRRLSPLPFAYLKLSEGCRNRCNYCAIPLIRGPLRSRPLEELVEEARLMLSAGVREIDLVAQDLTAWGIDLGVKEGLAGLIRRIDSLNGDFWLRLLYLHPAGVTRELVHTIASARHVVPYVEMPIQHVDPQVLDSMGRRGGAAAVERALELLAEAGGIYIRTTVLVGFPSEDQVAFERLCSFLRQGPFWRVACFGYSPQKGTPACNLKPLPGDEVKERLNEVLEVVDEVHWQKNQQMVGRVLPCLVEGKGRGRIALQAPEIDGVVGLEGDAPIRSFCKVRIEDAHGTDLFGRVVI